MRAARPAAHPLEQRLDALAAALREERPGAVWRGGLDGAALLPDGSVDREATRRLREELRGWIRAAHDPGAALGAIEGAAHLRDLARLLGLSDGPGGDALSPEAARWFEERRAVEIGAGPWPCLAHARFACATVVDPLADGYQAEGLIPAVAGRVTFLAACADSIPLAGAGADLVIVPARLPAPCRTNRAAAEVARILDAGGVVWVCPSRGPASTPGAAPVGAPDGQLIEALARAGLERWGEAVERGASALWRKRG